MSYEEKFKGLIAVIQKAQTDRVETILIQSPETLGDDYAEMVESLNRISEAGLLLQIVPPKERKRPDPNRN